MVVNVLGSPVRGENLYGRAQFVELLWRELGKGSVLLAAPRRFGKTSVMYRLIDEPQGAYKVIHADLEEHSEAVDLMLELVVKLSKDTRLGRLLDGITAVSKDVWKKLQDTVDEVELFDVKLKLREGMKENWEDVGHQIFKRISKAGVPVLFILDEFPMMIDRIARRQNRPEEARALLRWLRSLRQNPELDNVRFLIAGSIGIDAVLNRMGEISAINDLRKIQLEPFSPATASAFLGRLAETDKVPLSPECRSHIVELIGIPIPYFLQIMFSKVSESYLLTKKETTADTITRLYHDKVLGVDCKTYFQHYYGRLRDYYLPNEEKAVKRMLREMARVGGLTRDACLELYRQNVTGDLDPDEFDATMSNLENDFYLRYDTDSRRYEFSCKLLRDWWLRHYALEAA